MKTEYLGRKLYLFYLIKALDMAVPDVIWIKIIKSPKGA